MTLPPVVSDPEVCPEGWSGDFLEPDPPHAWDPENWECGSCDYGLPMNCTCPIQVCRYCGGRKP